MIAKFFRNAGLLAGAEIIARGKGLIVLPILSHHLGTADFGVWSQVSVLVFTLAPLIVLGSDSGLMRLLPGHDADRQGRQFSAWIATLLTAAVLAASMVALGHTWVAAAFFGSAAEYSQYMPLAAASLFATLLYSACRLWFVIRHDARVIAVATVTQAVFGVGAVALAVAAGLGVFEIIACGILADLMLGIAMVALLGARGALRRPDFGIIGPALRFGLPLLPAGYAMWGLNWMDRLFLVHNRGLADIGIYTAAYSLGYAVIQVFVNPIWAMYPNAAAELYNRKDREGVDRLLHATSGAIVAVAAPAIAGLWALDTPIMSLIAGPSYVPGALAMPIIALAYLLLMLASFADVALGLTYRQYLATVSIVLATGVNLALNVLLIPRYGIMGAASATLGAFVFHLLCSSYFAARAGPFWRHFRPSLKVVGAAILMAACVRGLDELIGGSAAVRVGLLVPTGAVVFLALAVALRTAPPALDQALREWLLVWLKPRAP